MPAAHPLPQTLGELRTSPQFAEACLKNRSVKDEMRANLITRLQTRETLFPGIVGYDDTVVPQIVNAVLSKQNFILLGLRGQAKSRILRALTALLDEHSALHRRLRDSRQPLRAALQALPRSRSPSSGDATPIAYMGRDARYVEKLATPDVTVADLVGDLDPIKAARGAQDLSSELTMHYGLLPRANRGIFAINELPDLAGKIQVALFNIMQEGDVQIKGYPVRLALDVALVFSANPEDYTARGKIVTPLKDRIGSEIRTHYPETLEEGIAITAQEAWAERGASAARDSAICPRDRRAGRLLCARRQESRQAQRRQPAPAHLHHGAGGLQRRTPRAGATTSRSPFHASAIIYAALPGITGKLELEYEGEMRGADVVVRELIRTRGRQNLRPLLRRTSTPSRSSSGSTLAARSSSTTISPALRARRSQADSGPARQALAARRSGFAMLRRRRLPQRSSCSKAWSRIASSAAAKSAASRRRRKQQRKPERPMSKCEFEEWERARRSAAAAALTELTRRHLH